jgi:hypothetical protein
VEVPAKTAAQDTIVNGLAAVAHLAGRRGMLEVTPASARMLCAEGRRGDEQVSRAVAR